MIATEEGLVDYWARITSAGDFLGPPPSYTSIREPLKRLCHRLIAFTIFGRVMDTVSWVAEDPPRKLVGAAGRGAEIDLEGLQDAPMG
ncbi:hypothetical protein Tco_1036714 [Tanacetum coccineum]